MATYYILENLDEVQVKVTDLAFAKEMELNGWKFISTITEPSTKEEKKKK